MNRLCHVHSVRAVSFSAANSGKKCLIAKIKLDVRDLSVRVSSFSGANFRGNLETFLLSPVPAKTWPHGPLGAEMPTTIAALQRLLSHIADGTVVRLPV